MVGKIGQDHTRGRGAGGMARIVLFSGWRRVGRGENKEGMLLERVGKSKVLDYTQWQTQQTKWPLKKKIKGPQLTEFQSN